MFRFKSGCRCWRKSPLQIQFLERRRGPRVQKYACTWCAYRVYKWSICGIVAAGVITYYKKYHKAEEITNKPDTTSSREYEDQSLDLSGLNTLTSPEALFQQYASVKTEDGQHLMTTSDFLRVITPFETTKFDTSSFEEDLTDLLNSIDIDNDGLINFREFIMFTTLLSIPPKYSRIAFRMFDTDGNGCVDVDEFKDMIRLVGQSNPITSKAELHKILEEGSVDGVFPFFFGKDGKQELEYDRFSEFIRHLRNAVATVQFKMISNGRDWISAQEYALSLISYGATKYNPLHLTRVGQLHSCPIRITEEDYKSFLGVLECLDEIDFVLRSFVSAGDAFTKQQLKRAAKAVAQVDLSDNLLEIIFFVFDKDGDGKLDEREFMGTLQERQQFGFSKPKDGGFIRFGKCMQYCWNEEVSDRSAKPIA